MGLRLDVCVYIRGLILSFFFRQKELTEKYKALLESKDEELKEMKIRYLQFASTSDLPGHMHTAIRKPSSIHLSFSFHHGKEEVTKCILDYLNSLVVLPYRFRIILLLISHHKAFQVFLLVNIVFSNLRLAKREQLWQIFSA